MKVFLIIFGYVFFVGWLSKALVNDPVGRIHSKHNNGATPFSAFLIMLLPIIFIGLRTSFGDTYAYISSFRNLTTDFNSIRIQLDPIHGAGWTLLLWIIKRFITQNANVFLIIIAFLQGTSIARLYYRLSIDSPYSILLFFLSMTFLYMMNGLRQFMAISVILFFADWIFEKRYIRFAIVVLIAATIHISALLWLPAVFVVQGKPFSWRVLFSSLLIVLAIVFVDRFTNLLEETLAGTAYEGYTDHFSNDNGSNIMHTIILCVPVLLSFLCRRIIHIRNDRRINILVNNSVLAMMISLLANYTSGILVGRLPVFFAPFNFILLPWLFENAFTRSSRSVIRFLCVAGYLAYALYYINYMGLSYSSTLLGL